MADIQKVYRETGGNVTTTLSGNDEIYPVSTSESVYVHPSHTLKEILPNITEPVPTLATESSVTAVSGRVSTLEALTRHSTKGNEALYTNVTTINSRLDNNQTGLTSINSRLTLAQNRITALEQAPLFVIKAYSTWPSSATNNDLAFWVGEEDASHIYGMLYKFSVGTPSISTYIWDIYKTAVHEEDKKWTLELPFYSDFGSFIYDKTNHAVSGELIIHLWNHDNSLGATYLFGTTTGTLTSSEITNLVAWFGLTPSITIPPDTDIYTADFYIVFNTAGTWNQLYVKAT